jgi:hypothetical protein
MNKPSASLAPVLPNSAHFAFALSCGTAHTGNMTANMPDTRRQQNLLEETMLHDLYLMSANPSLEAAARRNFNHRSLPFTEMAASCKNRGLITRERKSHTSGKNIFLAIIKGVVRT